LGRSIAKIAGSASGSISQRYGSADPQILLSPNKNGKKNFYSYSFVTSFRLFIFENDVNNIKYTLKRNKQKACLKKLSFLLAS
jgi:hypothetical protein